MDRQQIALAARHRVRRRDLVAILAGAALARPIAASAQQKTMPVIGILDVGDPAPLLKALREGLLDQGYVEGQNIRLEIRSPAGSPKSLAELAKELAAMPVDVIVAKFTPAVRAAMSTTKTIPIVMAPAGAPVETGLIASLARPGGNVTGKSATAAELGGKRVELIRELLPAAKAVGVLTNPADPFAKPFIEEMQSAAGKLGIQVRSVMIVGGEDFEAAFSSLQTDGADCVVIQGSLPQKPPIEMALKRRLPAVVVSRTAVEQGALMSYASRVEEEYRGAAVYVAKILKGARPTDLPVEEPTRFELVINLKTAKTIGLAIPPSLVARADEVIE